MSKITIQPIHREQNKVADRLAKNALGRSGNQDFSEV